MTDKKKDIFAGLSDEARKELENLSDNDLKAIKQAFEDAQVDSDVNIRLYCSGELKKIWEEESSKCPDGKVFVQMLMSQFFTLMITSSAGRNTQEFMNKMEAVFTILRGDVTVQMSMEKGNPLADMMGGESIGGDDDKKTYH